MKKNTEPKMTNLPQRIDKIMLEMTIEEKIGQLNQVGTSIYGDKENLYEDLIREGKVGSFLSVYGSDKINKLQKIAVEESRLKIPLLFGHDVIHGFKTIFPIPLAESCSWDEDLLEKTARVSALESWATGIHWTFAPMIDIARDPRWGRISEGFGEDTYLNGILTVSKVKGYQGDDLSKNGNILACAKHFAAYGEAEGGRDYNTSDISYQKLQDVYLPPFKNAIDAGVGSIMTAFQDLNGVPCTANKYLLNTVLKKQFDFDGIIITDYNAIGELIIHGYSPNLKEAAKTAINLGINIDMCSFGYSKHLNELIDENSIEISQIDSTVRKILEFKFKLGLFDNPFKTDKETEKEILLKESHRKLARESAQKSIVLLKNENNLLPLNKKINTIGLIGPFIKNKLDLLGSWAFNGDENDTVSIYEAFNNYLGKNTKILSSKGCNIDDNDISYFDEALKVANESDVIIACMGETANMSGEAYSRSSIGLPKIQEKLLKKLKLTNKPIILVLINGRPLSIPWADENISSIIEAWQLGTESGNAICDVVFGDVNPSGKLTTTFPYSTGQIPLYYNHTNTGRPAGDKDSKNPFESKYIDVTNKALYPFGHGLSYTTFKYNELKILNKEIKKDSKLKLNITLKNTGKRYGDEIVQVYIQDLFASRVRPIKELKAFKKVGLKPNEEKIIEFEIDTNKLGFYNENLEYIVEKGDFKIYVGSSSEKLIEESFKII
jgi:beta-glucosidase